MIDGTGPGPDDAAWADEFNTACARRSVDGVGAHWSPPAVGRWLQIIVMPSFHAEVVITATDDGSTRRLVAHTAQCNLSNWDGYLEYPDLWPSDKPPPHPQPVSVERVLSRRAARRVWRAAPSARAGSELGGLDGVATMIRYRLEDQLVEIHSWSPPTRAKERRVIDIVLEMIHDTKSAPLAAAIDDCAKYFR